MHVEGLHTTAGLYNFFVAHPICQVYCRSLIKRIVSMLQRQLCCPGVIRDAAAALSVALSWHCQRRLTLSG